MNLRLRGPWVATVVAVVALGIGGAALATAQSPAPTVTVNVSPTAVAVDAPGPLASGPTRMNFVRPAARTTLNVYVVVLVPGVSIDQLAQTIKRDDATEGSSSLGLVSIQASVSLAPGQTQQAVTFTVKPDLTYYVVAEQEVDKGAVPRAFGSFTTSSTANGAVAPKPAATVRMQDLRFKGASTLPRTGVVRFENRDGTAHHAIAFPLRPGTTSRQFLRATRSEKAFGRVVAGAPITAQNVLSGGDTANDQELQFPKKGKYGFACFIDDHVALGMAKVITVK